MTISKNPTLIENKEIVVTSSLVKTVKLRAEYYEWVNDLKQFTEDLKSQNLNADLFTFLQAIHSTELFPELHFEIDSISVLPITTYETWWKSQINDKTRNMIRRAQKSGVVLREVEFNDQLIKGIKEIYDESPLRQGKAFKHYGKNLDVLRNDHISFLDRSQFIGAFYEDKLIGFIKLVHGDGISHLMQIISMIEHRNKAPTNALISEAVQICAQKGVPYLHYGIWSRHGLGDFKRHHAFERLDLKRFYIPLSLKGQITLALSLHRPVKELLPESWLNFILDIRRKWNQFKYNR